MSMNPVFTTNVRDKLVIVALISFGALAFVTAWIALGLLAFSSADKSSMITLIATVLAIVSAIITGLFGIYKGNPVSPGTSTTTEATISSTEPTKVISN
jgi:hypothetical protein